MPLSNVPPTSCGDSGGTHSSNATGEVSGVFVAVYGTTLVVGFVFNVTALVVFCRVSSKSLQRSHTTVYMTNLAAADLLLVLALPLRVYYHLGVRPEPHQRLCEWAGLVLLVNMYGSIFLLMCICLDRCVAVTFPMSVRVRDARKKSPAVCLGIWVFTFGASLPSYLLQDREVSSKLQCFGSLPVYTYTHPGIVFSTLTLGFGVPLCVMLACSWALLRAIRRSTAAQTDLVNSRKIHRMIGVSLFIFLLSFLPYHAALGLLYLYREDVPCPLLGAYRYSLMLACLNAMLDPVAYYFTTETFRKRMDLDDVRKKFQLNSHSSVQGNHNKTEAPINT